MTWLRQSTSVDIGVGPFLDENDGKTAETALSITQPDIRLKKNAAAWAAKNAAQTLTHEENGWYEVSLDTTDTNTLGVLIIAIHEAGALPVWKEYQVIPANVYDSLITGTDQLIADAENSVWDAQDALHLGAATFGSDILLSLSFLNTINVNLGTNGDGLTAMPPVTVATAGISAASFAASAIDSASLATSAVNEIRDAIAALAMVEPTGVPAVTATLQATLSWILALSRNKITQTSTTQVLRNDADTQGVGTSVHSDDGTTHTRGKFT